MQVILPSLSFGHFRKRTCLKITKSYLSIFEQFDICTAILIAYKMSKEMSGFPYSIGIKNTYYIRHSIQTTYIRYIPKFVTTMT